MATRLEHANIVVRNIDETVRFLKTAFPEFGVRREWRHDGTRGMHFGDEETYIALSESNTEPAEQWIPYAGRPGVNHLGYEVDDVEALRARLTEAGYKDSTISNDHPHRKRVYFYDPDGNDWEFVQYFSIDRKKRNDYELLD